MKMRRILIGALALVAVAATLLTVLSVHCDAVRTADRRLVRTVFDDAVARVRSVRSNVSFADDINNDMMLVRARAFQRLLALEPEMLDDPDGRFEECRRILGVDELHVSDGRGVLVCSYPKSSLGFALGSVAQSAEFMPAVSNRTFEFVQQPIVKATDGRAMQYAGVSRLDAPGVIQVGTCAEFVRELKRMVASNFLSSDVRVGMGGRMTIRELDGRETPLPHASLRRENVSGGPRYVLEGDAAGYRIRVEMPVRAVASLGRRTAWGFGVVAFLAFALLFVFAPRFRGDPSGKPRRLAANPVIVFLFVLFAVSSLLSWMMETSSAWHAAEARLAWSVKDVLASEDALWEQIADERRRSDGRLEVTPDATLADAIGENMVAGWHVGSDGYYFCYNEQTGEIVSCGSPKFHAGDTLAGVGFNAEKALGTSSHVFVTDLYGEQCLCASDHLDHGPYRVVSVLPKHIVDDERDRSASFTIVVLALVFVVLSAFMSRLSRVAGTLREFIAADKAKRAKDLQLARTIRRSVMPTDFPSSPLFEMSAALPEREGEEIGGEFYDFFWLRSGHLLLLVGEANASGISAAMEMMKTKAFVKSLAASSESLVGLVGRVNAEMCRVNTAKVSVAALFASYDPETGVLVAVNAGYDRCPTGVPESPALGSDGSSRYAAGRVCLAPGEEIKLGGIVRVKRLCGIMSEDR